LNNLERNDIILKRKIKNNKKIKKNKNNKLLWGKSRF